MREADQSGRLRGLPAAVQSLGRTFPAQLPPPIWQQDRLASAAVLPDIFADPGASNPTKIVMIKPGLVMI
jgi:hypothetical protein